MPERSRSAKIRRRQDDQDGTRNNRPQTAKQAHEESKLFEAFAGKRKTKTADANQKREMDLLNHQRWVIDRQKIGLSVPRSHGKRIRSPKHATRHERSLETLNFIRNSFKRKECIQFAEREPLSGKCICGRTRLEHDATASSSVDDITDLLNDLDGINRPRSRTNIIECGTNAYGYVHFESRGDTYEDVPAKYVRMSQTTEQRLISDLIYNHWRVSGPGQKLCVSVLTASHDAHVESTEFDNEERDSIAEALVSVTKATGGFVITEGINRTKAVRDIGDAFRKAQSVEQIGSDFEATRHIKLLGVTPWGLVQNNDCLLNASKQDFSNSHYENNQVNRDSENETFPLNADHSHFLLIDDGSVNGVSKHRLETFKIALFQTIKEHTSARCMLTLLLGGDLDCLVSIYSRLQRGYHVVVASGSGMMADILGKIILKNEKLSRIQSSSEPFKLTESETMQYKQELSEFLISTEDLDLDRVIEHLEGCLKFQDQLHFYDLSNSRKLPFDKFLFKTMLGPNALNPEQLATSLHSIVGWNQIDLMREVLEEADFEQNEGTEQLMTECLMKQKVEFVEALVEHGFAMRKYLRVEVLRGLYRKRYNSCISLKFQLDHFIVAYSSTELTLHDIHRFLDVLLVVHKQEEYEKDHPKFSFAQVKQKVVNKARKVSHYKEEVGNWILEKPGDKATFKDPFFELFLWALLCKKRELLDLFWYRSSHPILISVMAATILDRLAKLYELSQEHAPILELKKHFMGVTNEFLDIGFELDSQKTLSLLEQKYDRIGKRTLMEMAYSGWQTEVIANPQCQSVNKIHWKRGFVQISIKRSFFCYFCPLLIFTPFVKFNPTLGDGGGRLNVFQKILVFYRCPIVKYTALFFSFICLAVMYSYVALFSFRYEYTIPEMVLYVWLLIILLGEIRELVTLRSSTFKGKLALYFTNIWNLFDIGLVVLTLVVFIIKSTGTYLWVGRILFASNTAMVMIQLFRYYHASWKLGPKLVTLLDMVPEIFTFTLLLVIFMLAYGVATQAMTDPYRIWTDDTWKDLFAKIIFLPYWQMYGELSLDAIEVVDIPPCGNTGNVTDAHCYPHGVDNPHDYRYVPQIYLALYMLFSNVMLLNMLIAVFTSLFDNVNSNSLNVWKWEMYRLVSELDDKPGLPPPLVVFEDAASLFIWMWKKCCGRRSNDGYGDGDGFAEADRTLQLFEKNCLKNYLMEEKEEQAETLDMKLEALGVRARNAVDLLQKSIRSGFNVMEAEEKVQDTSAKYDLNGRQVSLAHTQKVSRKLMSQMEKKLNLMTETLLEIRTKLDYEEYEEGEQEEEET